MKTHLQMTFLLRVVTGTTASTTGTIGSAPPPQPLTPNFYQPTAEYLVGGESGYIVSLRMRPSHRAETETEPISIAGASPAGAQRPHRTHVLGAHVAEQWGDAADINEASVGSRW